MPLVGELHSVLWAGLGRKHVLNLHGHSGFLKMMKSMSTAGLKIYPRLTWPSQEPRTPCTLYLVPPCSLYLRKLHPRASPQGIQGKQGPGVGALLCLMLKPQLSPMFLRTDTISLTWFVKNFTDWPLFISPAQCLPPASWTLGQLSPWAIFCPPVPRAWARICPGLECPTPLSLAQATTLCFFVGERWAPWDPRI